MVNWTDYGLVIKVQEVTIWAGQAYAPTACVRDGNVWLYFPNGANSIGVAVPTDPKVRIYRRIGSTSHYEKHAQL